MQYYGEMITIMKIYKPNKSCVFLIKSVFSVVYLTAELFVVFLQGILLRRKLGSMI